MSINVNNVSLDIKKPNLGLSNEKAAREFVSANLLQIRDKVSAYIADFGNSMDMWGCSEQDGSILMNLKERDIILSNRSIINDEIEKENKSCFSAFLSAINLRNEIAYVPIPYNIENSEKPIPEMSDVELKGLEFQIKTESMATLEKMKITPRVIKMVWARRKQLVDGGKQSSTILQPTQILSKEQSIAATKLQSIVRRRRAQDKETVLKRTYLPPAQMEEAKSRCNGSWTKEDRALNGKSTVYLPKESSYVYKRINADMAENRLMSMEQAHEICERSGYQDLVVPQARGYGEFLIEKKLPFEQNSYTHMKLYAKNHEKFDNAVTEFMGFLCQSYLSDIIDERGLGRYDNVPLYIEDGRGKIGLIDLEQFYPVVGEVEDWLFVRCQDAVRLFPYHLDQIMEVAKKIDPAIEKERDQLIVERDRQLKMFKEIG
jgi:hypothetical protein